MSLLKNQPKPQLPILVDYIASCYVKHVGHYSQPKPHPIWWRRLLGQTISYEIGWERKIANIRILKGMEKENWFHAMLCDFMKSYSELEPWGEMLEQRHTETPYIATAATTNELLNSKEIQL
jgi:hypothetical protein